MLCFLSFLLDVMATARHEACFVMVNGLAYLIGGRGYKRIDIYNPVTRTWSTGQEPPIQLHHMQCVAVGTRSMLS